MTRTLKVFKTSHYFTCLNLLLITLAGQSCTLGGELISKNSEPLITAASVTSNSIQLTGNNLDQINNLTLSGPNFSRTTIANPFTITSKTATRLTAVLISSAEIVATQMYSLLISTAQASGTPAIFNFQISGPSTLTNGVTISSGNLSVSSGSITSSGAVTAGSITSSGAVNAQGITSSNNPVNVITTEDPTFPFGAILNLTNKPTGPDAPSSNGALRLVALQKTAAFGNQPAAWLQFGSNASSGLEGGGKFYISALNDTGSEYFSIIGPADPVHNGPKVGIGEYDPQKLLHVRDYFSSGSVARFENTSGRCDLTPSAGAATWSCSSDERLKRDIRTVGGDEVLGKLQSLQAVTYALKKEPSGARHTGYLAQQVQKIAPEFVSQGEDGFLSVSYTGFIPWITEAVKELTLRIQHLSDSKNEELRKIKELETKINRLEIELKKLQFRPVSDQPETHAR